MQELSDNIHREMRETKRQKKSGKRKWWAKGDFWVKGILFGGFVLSSAYFFPRGISYQYADYKEEMVMENEIIAPFDFPILKDEAVLERERESARLKVLPHFVANIVQKERLDSLTSNFFLSLNLTRNEQNQLLSYINSLGETITDEEKKRISTQTGRIDSLKRAFSQNYSVNLGEDWWNFFLMNKSIQNSQFAINLRQIISASQNKGILDRSKESLSQYEKITIVIGDDEEIRDLNEVYDEAEILESAYREVKKLYPGDSDTIMVAYEILKILLKPNLYYDTSTTEERQREAVAGIPLTRGFVRKGERIIDSHEIVTSEIAQKIKSLRVAISEQALQEGGWRQIIPYFGQVLFLGILTFIMLFYFFIYRRKIFDDNGKMSLVILILFSQIVFAYFIIGYAGLSEYLIPTTLASMLLTIFFDPAVGLIGTVFMAVTLGGFMGNEYAITIVSLTVGTVAVYSVRHVRNRSLFFKTMLYINFAYLVSIVAVGMLRFSPLESSMETFLRYCVPNGIASPIITLGVLYIFEAIFGITTDMSLLELSDLNKTLLRNLLLRAPGTYHHSIMVGNMAEIAAEAIEANSLLTRVGAYYHDIGKMFKPEYYSENQTDGYNPHEKLAPSMSCLILVAHIKDGIELAYKNKLPKEIIDFIPQHHGTEKISFFYDQAIKNGDPKYINEEDFHYPGPLPQTREAGILMLADGTEAAVRSLKNPSANRIREAVEAIIDVRFQNGQLDECDLTLRDLKLIAESFTKILTSMYHSRIEYPRQKPDSTVRSDNIEKAASR